MAGPDADHAGALGDAQIDALQRVVDLAQRWERGGQTMPTRVLVPLVQECIEASVQLNHASSDFMEWMLERGYAVRG